MSLTKDKWDLAAEEGCRYSWTLYLIDFVLSPVCRLEGVDLVLPIALQIAAARVGEYLTCEHAGSDVGRPMHSYSESYIKFLFYAMHAHLHSSGAVQCFVLRSS